MLMTLLMQTRQDIRPHTHTEWEGGEQVELVYVYVQSKNWGVDGAWREKKGDQIEFVWE